MEIKKSVVEYPDMLWAIYKHCTKDSATGTMKIVPVPLSMDEPFSYKIIIDVVADLDFHFAVHVTSEFVQKEQILSISLFADNPMEILNSIGWENFSTIVLEYSIDAGCDVYPTEGDKLFTIGFTTRDQFDELMGSLMDYVLDPTTWEWADEYN